MSPMAIHIDQIAAELSETLAAYTEEIAGQVKEAVDLTAKELLKNIRADAPKRTGAYKNAMAVKTVSENAYEKKRVWYVKDPHYRLQHLLEHGHALRGGGRVKAYPHIEKNEERARAAFEERVERIIKNDGK